MPMVARNAVMNGSIAMRVTNDGLERRAQRLREIPALNGQRGRAGDTLSVSQYAEMPCTASM